MNFGFYVRDRMCISVYCYFFYCVYHLFHSIEIKDEVYMHVHVHSSLRTIREKKLLQLEDSQRNLLIHLSLSLSLILYYLVLLTQVKSSLRNFISHRRAIHYRRRRRRRKKEERNKCFSRKNKERNFIRQYIY